MEDSTFWYQSLGDRPTLAAPVHLEGRKHKLQGWSHEDKPQIHQCVYVQLMHHQEFPSSRCEEHLMF